MIEHTSLGPGTSILEREAWLASRERHKAEGLVLATCDRVEWYHGSGQPRADTARHLFRLAAGLESPLLGETQILHQIKTTYQAACQSQHLDAGMHRLFQSALHCGKQVRHHTGIARGAVGHALGVVRLLEREFGASLPDQPVMLIGVNNLNQAILRYLRDRGGTLFFLGNRTFPKASALAGQFGATAFGLDQTGALMAGCSILISATSAPHFVVHPRHFARLGPGEGPRVLIDLAVPRDIDPAVARPGRRSLYNHHDLEELLAQEHRQRRLALPAAEALIDQHLEKFYEHLSRRFPPEHPGPHPDPRSPGLPGPAGPGYQLAPV